MLKTLMFRDLNFTIGWSGESEGLCPTLTTGSVVWVRGPLNMSNGTVMHLDRRLCGEECLRLQGVGVDKTDMSLSRGTAGPVRMSFVRYRRKPRPRSSVWGRVSEVHGQNQS